MSIKDGRKIKTRGYTRRTKRAYDKCRKHLDCRKRVTSIWHELVNRPKTPEWAK